MLAKGHEKGGLYALEENEFDAASNNISTSAFPASVSNNASYSIWHKRMGHMNDRSLKLVNKTLLIYLVEKKKK